MMHYKAWKVVVEMQLDRLDIFAMDMTITGTRYDRTALTMPLKFFIK